MDKGEINIQKTIKELIVVGILFGIMFPVMAMITDIIVKELPFSFSSILLIHKINPIHFIINTAPIILPLAAYYVSALLKKQFLEAEDTAQQLEKIKKSIVYIDQLSEGELDFKIELQENDHIGNSIIKLRENLIKNKKENTIRSWNTAGVTKFAEILRSTNSSIKDLSNTVLSNLIKLIKANQGNIFIVAEDEENKNEHLDLLACYAFETKKHLTHKIEKGQGLVGQCWKSGETIYLTEIPQDYTTITSGLGAVTPGCLLITPLKLNEVTIGVLEMAAFQEFKDFEIAFIKQIAKNIAATFIALQTNLKTEQLLKESHALTEQMQSQEEEMRQNMEELQATQEELSRNNDEISSKTLALEKQQGILETWQFDVKAIINGIPNTVIVIDNNNTIEDTNKSGETLTGCKVEKMIGRDLQDFLPEIKIKDIPLNKRINTIFLDKNKDRHDVIIISSNIVKKKGKRNLYLIRKLSA